MEIHLAADHRGLAFKNELKEWLVKEGYKVVDQGAEKLDKHDDYPDFGFKVALAVKEKPIERRGILICGSGVGMAVVANKIEGVRAALIHDPGIARMARRDDDVNVLALGSDFIDLTQARRVVKAWLESDFSKETRHVRRLKKIEALEERKKDAPHH